MDMDDAAGATIFVKVFDRLRLDCNRFLHLENLLVGGPQLYLGRCRSHCFLLQFSHHKPLSSRTRVAMTEQRPSKLWRDGYMVSYTYEY